MKATIDSVTGLLIESQSDFASDAVLLANAAAIGHQNAQVITVTQAVLDTLIASRDVETADNVSSKAKVLEEAREMRSEILNALTGIQMYDISPADTVALSAIATARQALKDLPTNPTVVAAVTELETHAAVMAAWKTIAANLALASQPAAVAFKRAAMW